jgi:glycosyltransferase involved in cell wall biosynthesis
MDGPALSVVIPVFNEEREIERILRAVPAALEPLVDDWEILVVDNASTDRTREAVAPLADGHRVRLIVNDANRGKGYSIRRGMLEARGQLRLMCDADCQPSLISLPRMVELAGHADVVVGSRVAEGSRVERQQPLRRRIVGFGFLALSHALLRPPARDIFCGFKLWRAEAAEAVFSRSRLDGWSFDVEALALAAALGYRVHEAGIVWVNRPSSRLSIGGTLAPALRELLAARRHVRAVAAERDPADASRPVHAETRV